MWAEAMSSGQVRQDRGDLGQQPGPVKAFDLDDGELVGQRIGDVDLRPDSEGPGLALAAGFAGNHFRDMRLARQHVLDHPADRGASPEFVLVVGQFAVDQDRVECPSVRGGEDLRVGDVGAGCGTGAGDDRQQTRMVGRQQRDFGDGVERMGAHHGGQLLFRLVGIANELGVPHLLLERHGQQIGFIMQLHIGLAVLLAPVGESMTERLASVRRALLARDLGKAA